MKKLKCLLMANLFRYWGKTFETYNPATEDVLAVVCEAQEEDIDLCSKSGKICI